jgi:hypothetical protein
MGAFWDALGQGLERYASSHRNKGLGGVLLNAIHPPADPNPYNPQLDRTPATSADPRTVQSLDQNASTGGLPMGGGDEIGRQDQPIPDLSMSSGSGSGFDMFGSGKMVTEPTLAMVGDKGPEAVVPLTDQPGSKTSPGMLGGAPRTRWRHPLGPVASKRTAPIRSLLPVKPNVPFR